MCFSCHAADEDMHDWTEIRPHYVPKALVDPTSFLYFDFESKYSLTRDAASMFSQQAPRSVPPNSLSYSLFDSAPQRLAVHSERDLT